MGLQLYAMDFIHFLTSPGPRLVSFAEGRDAELNPGMAHLTLETRTKKKGPHCGPYQKSLITASGCRLATPCESGDSDQTKTKQRQ